MDRLVDAWVDGVAAVDRSDPIWGLRAYRLARFALHLATQDARRGGHSRTASDDQLVRAIASISANIGEGYGRPSFAEQA